MKAPTILKLMALSFLLKATTGAALLGATVIGSLNESRRQRKNIAISGETEGLDDEIFLQALQILAKRDKNLAIEDLRKSDDPIKDFYERAKRCDQIGHFFVSRSISPSDLAEIKRAVRVTPLSLVYYGRPDDECGSHIIAQNGQVKIWRIK